MNAKSQKCQLCSERSYSLESSRGECRKCKNNEDGYDCKGADTIEIEYGWWIKVRDENKNEKEEQEEEEEDDDRNNSLAIVASAQCAGKFCCQRLKDGCDYLSDAVSGKLCAYGRDPNVEMCGGCLKVE